MKDVSFPQRSRLRSECARLLRFARGVDLLCAETMLELMQASLSEINLNIQREPGAGLQHGHGHGHGHLIFKVKATLKSREKSFQWHLEPDEDLLFEEFMTWLQRGSSLAIS